MEATFDFTAELFEWTGEAAWVFVTLPIEVADEIRDIDLPRTGFGSVRVTVRVGSVEWATSVFPDKASGSYLLPVKKAIRTRAGIDIGDTAPFQIDVALP